MSLPAVNNESSAQQSLAGLATLMTMAYQQIDLTDIGQRLIERASNNEAEAFLDLSVLLQLQGQVDTGVALQNEALAIKQHYTLHPGTLKRKVKLLAFLAPGNLMTNTPLEFIAEGAGFTLEMFYISPELNKLANIPEHDIAMVALSELDRNLDTLKFLQPIVETWPKPVLNLPNRVATLPRDMICNALQSVSGLTMPVTYRITRDKLQRLASGDDQILKSYSDLCLPMIIRPIDSHAGKGLAQVSSHDELGKYLAYKDQSVFFVSRFVDYRSADGQFRKYRVMLMQGKAYIAHMAISDHWMVHYLNAGMAQSAEKRLEEAYVMGTFDQQFAQKHRQALHAIWKTTGLDYLGLDCAETQQGDLLVFEIGASMNVHAMDSTETYPYKAPQMRKVFDGFATMLENTINEHNIQQTLVNEPRPLDNVDIQLPEHYRC